MDATAAVLKARELLETVTPLHQNCGLLCGSACCIDSEAGEGMLLFPGEAALYENLPEGFTLQPAPGMQGAWLLGCSGQCERADRPLACRFFPLIPYIRKDNNNKSAGIMMDVRAWPVCPLMEGGLSGCSREFARAAAQAAGVLCAVEEHRVFLTRLTQIIDGYRQFS